MAKVGGSGTLSDAPLADARTAYLALAGLLVATTARGEGRKTYNPPKLREFVFTSTKPNTELQGLYPNGWRVVCIGSCRTQAFVGAAYRVSGGGVPTSDTFAVSDGTYPFSVRAHAGSTSEQVWGDALLAVGSVALAATLFLFPLSVCGDSCSGVSQAERDRGAVAASLLWPVLLGGVVMTAAGVALLVDGTPSLDIRSGEQARTPRLRLGRAVQSRPGAFQRLSRDVHLDFDRIDARPAGPRHAVPRPKRPATGRGSNGATSPRRLRSSSMSRMSR